MGRVLTNNTALQYAIESTELADGVIGLLPGETGAPAGTPVWYELEPNTYGNIGSTISTVARNPISRNRQNRKGTITDLDSAAEFEADLTFSHFIDFAEGFVFSTFNGSEIFDPASTDTDSYTVVAGSALTANTLVYGRGFTETANNGLKLVDTGATTTDIPVTTALVAETAPSNATVEVAGFRTAAGDLAVTTVSGTQVTITSTANIFNDNGLNLQPGAAIFFGGAAAINQFTNSENVGYGRIVSVANDGSQVVIDKTSQTWTTEAAVAQEVDFYVGQFLRNVPTDDAEFLERSFQFEITYPNLANNPSGPAYEYSRGNYCNTLAFNLPLTDKATISPAFIGLDTDPPTTTRKTEAATPIVPTRTSSVNTTQDCARLRITDVDETGITTDFKSLTLTLNNNVSPEKVLCNLGARFMNYGNFEVSAEAQVLFSDAAVVSAIRNNQTVAMDFILENDDGSLHVDIPAMTLGGGGKDFPVNETVLINLTGTAFADPTLNTSIGMTLFPFIPTLS